MTQPLQPQGIEATANPIDAEALQQALQMIRRATTPLLHAAGISVPEEQTQLTESELRRAMEAVQMVQGALKAQYQERFLGQYPQLNQDQQRRLKDCLILDDLDPDLADLAMRVGPQEALALYLLATSEAKVVSIELPNPITYEPEIVCAVAEMHKVRPRAIEADEESFPPTIKQLIYEGHGVSDRCSSKEAAQLAARYGCRLATQREFAELDCSWKLPANIRNEYWLQEGNRFFYRNCFGKRTYETSPPLQHCPLLVITLPLKTE